MANPKLINVKINPEKPAKRKHDNEIAKFMAKVLL